MTKLSDIQLSVSALNWITIAVCLIISLIVTPWLLK